MSEGGVVIKRRKERIIKWLKDPHHIILVGIVLLALAIRLYYFFLTIDQPLWWDEAEYLSMARRMAFGIDYPFLAVRPMLFSIIVSLFFSVSQTELLPRILIFLFSFASIPGMYMLGKEIYGKKVGLLSAFLMSVFYLNLFFTYRLLVDLPSMTLSIFASVYFYRYFKDKSNKALYIAFLIVGVGTLIRTTTAVLLFAIIAFLLITQRISFLKRKELWIGSLIFLLILAPYFIWGYFEFGGFVLSEAAAINGPQGNPIVSGYNIIKNYIALFPTYFSWATIIAFIFGISTSYQLVIGFDMINKSEKLQRELFVLLLFIVPFIVISIVLAHNENRYIMAVFPLVFLIASKFVVSIFNLIKKKHALSSLIFLILFIGVVLFHQIPATDNLIKSKIDSYRPVKDSGLWIRENSKPGDIVVSHSFPQMTFYSQRKVEFFSTEEKLNLLVNETPPRYIMVSVFESQPEWVQGWLEKNQNKLSVVNAYFADAQNQQAVLVVYELT